MTTASPYARVPLTAELAGRPVDVPYRPAVDWIAAVSAVSGPRALLAHVVEDGERDKILDALAIGNLTDTALADASYALLRAAVPAFAWWEAYRLLHLSTDRTVSGRCALAGLDPWVLTAAQWCAALYVLLRESADQKDQFKFDAALSTPPPDAEDDDWGDMNFDEMVSAARSTPGMG